MSVGSLLTWLDASPERSARVREARERSARAYAAKAEEVILAAKDKLSMDKARELAHHYRWTAKMHAPKDYGDRVTHDGNVNVSLADVLRSGAGS